MEEEKQEQPSNPETHRAYRRHRANTNTKPINSRRAAVRPSARQVAYARSLAAERALPVPVGIEDDVIACSDFIASLKGEPARRRQELAEAIARQEETAEIVIAAVEAPPTPEEIAAAGGREKWIARKFADLCARDRDIEMYERIVSGGRVPADALIACVAARKEALWAQAESAIAII